MKKLGWAVWLACGAGLALAQGYVGAAGGVTHTRLACTDTLACTRGDTGVKLYAGYRYSPGVAGELGYVDFGNASVQRMPEQIAISSGVGVSAVTAALTLRMDLASAWTGVARLGVARVRTAVDETAVGLRTAQRVEEHVRPYVGLALEYALAQGFAAVLSADVTQARIDGSQGGVQLIGLGLQYAF